MNRKGKVALAIAVLVVILAGVVSSGLKEHYYLAPTCVALPDYALVWVSSEKTLSFADVDTVTPVRCSLEMSNGWLRDWFLGKPQIVAGNPGLITGGNNSTALTLRYMTRGNPTSGYPLVIHEDGTILKCPENEHTPYGSERSWLLSETRIVTVDYGIETRLYRVIVFDMQTCSEVNELYVSDQYEGISEATISSQGWLAVACSTQHGVEIVIFNSDSKEIQRIPMGMYPAWSPDGEWLAYTIVQKPYTNQELHIVPKDSYDPIEIGRAPGMSYSSWSPNGSQLIYGGYAGNQPVTRIVDVATRIEVELPLYIPVRAAAWR